MVLLILKNSPAAFDFFSEALNTPGSAQGQEPKFSLLGAYLDRNQRYIWAMSVCKGKFLITLPIGVVQYMGKYSTYGVGREIYGVRNYFYKCALSHAIFGDVNHELKLN